MARKPIPNYIAILAPDRGTGGYAVFFPDLPGCVTQGDDLADAQAMATDVLSLWIATLIAHGDPVPPARPLEAIRSDKSFARENDIDWRDAVALLVPARPPLGRPERVNVSLDSNKLRAIDAYADRRGLTRSAVLEAGAELLLAIDPITGRGSSEAAPSYRTAAKPKNPAKRRSQRK
jgi:predicted RNase H-like HicB family nuclease